MTIRDLLLNVLIGIALLPFIFLVAAADSLPMWLLLVVAAILWVVYIVIVIRDHARDIKYPVLRYRPPATTTRAPKAPQTTPYDQKEDHV